MSASIKLGNLLVKTLAKPLANRLKRSAQQSTFFENICIQIAQSYNRLDMKLKMNFLDYKTEPITPLSEAKAVELGANFLSELIIFSVGAITIMGEAYRSNKSKNDKQKDMVDAIIELEENLRIHQLLLQSQQSQINDLIYAEKSLKTIVDEQLSSTKVKMEHNI
ncbi:optic atrophy 3 protein-domain-containing protein [Globomyces pollinis-pini]|nr:optic atrophy 3 protein-domain-containing protein [Globomyces pollinis-pini]